MQRGGGRKTGLTRSRKHGGGREYEWEDRGIWGGGGVLTMRKEYWFPCLATSETHPRASSRGINLLRRRTPEQADAAPNQ
eukprot:8110451-Pyramimonas_sp.AAC.1